MAYSKKIKARQALRQGNHKTDVIRILSRMVRGTWMEKDDADLAAQPMGVRTRVENALMSASRGLASECRARRLARRPAEVEELQDQVAAT